MTLTGLLTSRGGMHGPPTPEIGLDQYMGSCVWILLGELLRGIRRLISRALLGLLVRRALLAPPDLPGQLDRHDLHDRFDPLLLLGDGHSCRSTLGLLNERP